MDGSRNKALDRQHCNDYESVRFDGSKGTHISDPTLDRIERPWPPEEPAWVQEIRNQQALVLRVELYRHLETLTAGQRIRLLRRVRGWTQQRAAGELGVSRRIIIRHEQAEHQPQLSLWERL